MPDDDAHEYSESDLGILVWINEEFNQKSKNRLLKTLTTNENNNPIVFSIKHIQKTIPLSVLADQDTILDKILLSTKEKPVIVPISIAKSALGWNDFYVPPSFTEIL